MLVSILTLLAVQKYLLQTISRFTAWAGAGAGRLSAGGGEGDAAAPLPLRDQQPHLKNEEKYFDCNRKYFMGIYYQHAEYESSAHSDECHAPEK